MVLAIPSDQSNQTAKCHWTYQYLCGDKCLGLSKLCTCGNKTFNYVTFNNEYINCCQNKPCYFDFVGNVNCHGNVQKWWEKCNGNCVQKSVFGWLTLPCKTNDQCYIGIDSCQGVPKCKE